MEQKSINITSYDVSIFWEKRGENVPWMVFLHGLQSNKEVFTELMQQPFLQKFSLLALDFVGFGASSKPTNFSYELQDQAEVVKEVLEQLGIQEFHIIGHSMGGMIGTLLLGQRKTRVLSLVNLEGNLVEKDCGASLAIVEHQTFASFSAGGYEAWKRAEEKTQAPDIHKRLQWLSMIPDFVFYRSATSIVRWSKSEELLALFLNAPQKKLYVYGEKNAEKAQRLPSNIEKAEIQNAGHRMLADNPVGCYLALEKFYESL